MTRELLLLIDIHVFDAETYRRCELFADNSAVSMPSRRLARDFNVVVAEVKCHGTSPGTSSSRVVALQYHRPVHVRGE